MDLLDERVCGDLMISRRKYTRALLLCMCMILAASLALAAVVMLIELDKANCATSKKNDEILQPLRRDFVTLRDIEQVATAAASRATVGLITRKDQQCYPRRPRMCP